MLPEISLPNIYFSAELLLKVLFTLVMLGFLIYSLIMWRQVVLASKVLKTRATPWVRLMAVLYVVIVVGVDIVVSIVLWA